MKSFIANFALAAVLLLPACSLKRSDDARLRIDVADTQGRPVRGILSGTRNSSDLFDTAGHSRSNIDLSAAPGAACFFVGILGKNIKSSMAGKTMSGIKDSCSTFSEMGQVSDLVSFNKLQEEGVSLTLSVGTRAFTLYAINLEGYDAGTGCPATTLDQVTSYDKFAKVFAFAKGEATLDRQTTSVTLTQVDAKTLESLVPVSCYDAGLKAPREVAAAASSTTQVELSWADDNTMETGFYVDRSADGFSDWTRIATLNANAVSYSDSGLTSNSTYYYRVTAYNLASEAAGTIVNASTTESLPSTPANLALVPMAVGHISVTWDDPGAIVEVWRRFGLNDWEKVKTVAKGSLGSFQDNSGLLSDTKYFYRVRSKNADGYSPFSTEVSAFTFPDAPDAVQASVTSHSSITVSWNPKSTNQTGWRIEKSITGTSGWSNAATAAAGDVSKVIGSLNSNTKYYFRVIAQNEAGESAYSVAASATTRLSPPAITGTVVDSASSITVSWEGDAATETYSMSYKTGGGNWVTVPNITTTSASATGLLSHTLYRFKVVSYAGENSSAESAEVTQTTGLASPAITSIDEITDNSATLHWSAEAGADSYKVEFRPSGGGWSSAGYVAGTQKVVVLTANTTYEFRLSSHRDGVGDADPGEIATATTKLATPAISTAVADSATSITVSWGAISGAEDYEVSYREPGQEFWNPMPLTTNTSLPVSGLTVNTTYEFQLRAHSSSKGYSAASIPFGRMTKLPAPASVTVSEVKHNAFKVNWLAVTGAQSYKVVVAPVDGLSPMQTVLNVNGTELAVASLLPNNEYNVYVYAYHEANDFSDSNMILTKTKLTPPVIARVSAPDATSLTPEWGAITGASKYRLEYRAQGAGSWEIVDNITLLSKELALAAGTTYSFRVYAFSSDTGFSEASAEETAITGLQPPTNINLEAYSATTLRVTWDSVSGADGYKIEWRLYQSSGNWEEQLNASSGDLIGPMAEDTRYEVRVFSKTGSSYSGASSVAAETTLLAVPTTIITTLSTTVEKRIIVNWHRNTASERDVQILRQATGESFPTLYQTISSAEEFIDNNVDIGKAYVYQVRSKSAGNQSVLSATSNSVTPTLFPPTVLLANANGSETQIFLSWTDNSLAKNLYRVERSEDGGSNFSFRGNVISSPWNTYTDDVTLGTTYVYRVRAETSNGDVSDWSATSTPAHTSEILDKPASFRADTIGASHIHLAWTDPPSALGIEIAWRNALEGPETEHTINVSVGDEGYDHTYVTPDTSIIYKIRASYGPNEEDKSDWTSLTATTLPGVPEDFRVTSTTPATVNLAWTDTAEEYGYTLKFRDVADGPGASFQSVPNSIAGNDTSAIHDHLKPGHSYEYELRALYNAGDPSAAATIIANTTSGVPTGLQITTPNIAASSLRVTWTDLSSEDGYVLEYERAGDGTWISITEPEKDATYYDHTGLNPATSYKYRLKAKYGSEQSGWATMTSGVSTLDGKPTGFAISATSDTTITLAWTDTALESGYDLKFTMATDRSSELVWTAAPYVAQNAQSAEVSGLMADTHYYFKLRAKYSTSDSDWVYADGSTGVGWVEMAASDLDTPSARSGHTAVWTGSKMIVWGGSDGTNYFNDGAIFDPAASDDSSWVRMAAPPAGFEGRKDHTAVWTGSKMIVWGGRGSSSLLSTGAIYDPSGENADHTFGSWVPMNTTTYGGSYAVTGTELHTATWTGDRMWVVGGNTSFTGVMAPTNEVMAYDPEGDYSGFAGKWTGYGLLNLAADALAKHTAIWTGSELAVFGGIHAWDNYTGRYDFTAKLHRIDVGTPTVTTSTPIFETLSSRAEHVAVWTGTKMIVWGGYNHNGTAYAARNDGAIFDPVSGDWTALPSTTLAARKSAYAVWAPEAKKMVVFGGTDANGTALSSGMYYLPLSDEWLPMPTTGSPTAGTGSTMIWTGSDIIVWGGTVSGTPTNLGYAIPVVEGRRGAIGSDTQLSKFKFHEVGISF